MRITNEIEFQKFLRDNVKDNGKIILITKQGKKTYGFVTRYEGMGDYLDDLYNPLFLICEINFNKIFLKKIDKISIKKFTKKYFECETEDELNKKMKYVKSMIKGNYFYEFNSPPCKIQISEYDFIIQIASEIECLNFYLKNNKIK